VSAHDDTDNRGRTYDPTVARLQNLRAPHAKSRKNGPGGLDFLRRGLTFNREQFPAGTQQRRGPVGQPAQWCDRAAASWQRPP